MTITAPVLGDVDLSDPDEQMKVTNNGTKPVEWSGIRRLYTIGPKQTEFIPFHIVVRYLGDPRSDYKKSETFITPSGEKGVIPERRGELRRLGVLYGLYDGKLRELPKSAPKVTVSTLNDVQLQFPIFDPDGKVYRYKASDSAVTDPRTEFERLRAMNEATEAKMDALLARIGADDPDSGEAPEDSHPGM